MAVRRGGLPILLLLLPLFLVIQAGAASGPLPAASSEAFDSVLGNTASCHRACQLTYPLHTYPKEEELFACQRGCRLFSICQFVDDGADLNRTKQECDSGEPSDPFSIPSAEDIVKGRAAVSKTVVLNWWHYFSCFGFV
ncbi:hypothetical protein Nmel_011344 [Mimus melanotis]